MRILVQKQRVYRETAASMPPRPLHPHWQTGREITGQHGRTRQQCFSKARRRQKTPGSQKGYSKEQWFAIPMIGDLSSLFKTDSAGAAYMTERYQRPNFTRPQPKWPRRL
jgi:hypothetical protein